jgi:hypothetical protein
MTNRAFKSKVLISAMAVAFLAMSAVDTSAADCVLDSVAFPDVSDEQANALSSAGAKCDLSQSEFEFGQPGYVESGGERLSFLDLEVEDPFSLNGQAGVVIAYIDYVAEAAAGQSVGFRIDGEMYEGRTFRTNRGTVSGVNYTNPALKVVFLYEAMLGGSSAGDIGALRRETYRTLLEVQEDALIRVEGEFGLFSNTGDLFFEANSIEVLDRKPER